MIAAFTIFPILFSLLLSVENVNVTGSGFSLQGLTASNYDKVVTSGLWHHALWFTVLFTAVTVVVELVTRDRVRLDLGAPHGRPRLHDGAHARPVVVDNSHFG